MLWRNRRQSNNIVDLRGRGAPVGIGGLVIGAVIYYLMGGNPLEYIGQNTAGIQRQEISPSQNEDKEFVSVILADTEDVWNQIFKENNLPYREPKLVLFNGVVDSACGRAGSSVGPFYCPADHQVYLDLSFFQQLSRGLGAEGDFAQAYVVAHEVGHHVQKLLGIEGRMREQQRNLSVKESNRLSVLLELQADCLAGVWASQTQKAKNVLEEGDIDEALNAASAVGDDKLQKASRGQVVPDSFTHGTSAQRASAFRNGLESGNLRACEVL